MRFRKQGGSEGHSTAALDNERGSLGPGSVAGFETIVESDPSRAFQEEDSPEDTLILAKETHIALQPTEL